MKVCNHKNSMIVENTAWNFYGRCRTCGFMGEKYTNWGSKDLNRPHAEARKLFWQSWERKVRVMKNVNKPVPCEIDWSKKDGAGVI